MIRKSRRLVVIACLGVLLGAATALVLTALEDGITFFSTPSEIASGAVADGRRLRVGGLVEVGSVTRGAGGDVTFRVTDQVHSVPVTYVGLLPRSLSRGAGRRRRRHARGRRLRG